MIKLNKSIWEEVQLDDQQAYWMDFDEGMAAFTMEVNTNDLDGQLNDLEDILQLMEVYND